MAEAIKGSRFVARVQPVATVEEALAVLDQSRAEHPDASHHCWAFRLASSAVRCSDDGEPSGTAGRPILARLEGRDLVDVMVVVVRWFGGTKLGAGGLVRAYGRTAGDALDLAETAPWVLRVPVRVLHDYADGAAVEAVLADLEMVTEYSSQILRSLTVEEDQLPSLQEALMDATAGRARLERL